MAVALILAFAPVAKAAEAPQEDGWHFAVIPYIWVPSVIGKLNITPPKGGGSGSTDLASSDYLNNLSFAAMLSVEAQNGPWSVLTDIMYVNFSDDNRQATFSGNRVTVIGDTGVCISLSFCFARA